MDPKGVKSVWIFSIVLAIFTVASLVFFLTHCPKKPKETEFVLYQTEEQICVKIKGGKQEPLCTNR